MDGCDIQGLANVQLMTFRWRSWNSSFVTSFWYVTWWRNARCEWLSAAWVENASSVAALQMFSQRSIQSPQFNSEQQGPQSPVYSHIKCEIRSQSDFCPLAVAYKVLRLLNFIMSQWIWPLTLSSVHFMQWDMQYSAIIPAWIMSYDHAWYSQRSLAFHHLILINSFLRQNEYLCQI